MSSKTCKRIHLIYSAVLSILLTFAGICLIVACVGIYRSGDKPFSPEAVSAAFSGIAVPVYLCVALIVGGFVLEGFLPIGRKKTALQKQHKAILDRLYQKADMRYAPPHIQAEIKTMQNRRKLFKGITLGLLVLGSVIFLIYGLNPANFHQSEINGSMVKAMGIFLPCLAIPFGYGLFTAYYERATVIKETELVKQVIVGGAKAQPQAAEPKKDFGKVLLAVRCCLLVVGIGILVYGFISGGTQDVMTKAINICTECVGLG